MLSVVITDGEADEGVSSPQTKTATPEGIAVSKRGKPESLSRDGDGGVRCARGVVRPLQAPHAQHVRLSTFLQCLRP